MDEDQWDQTEHELTGRLALITKQARITAEQSLTLSEAITGLVADRVIEIIPRAAYEHFQSDSRRRVPRDPHDWSPVALALALDAAILTGDGDFLGCGVPTWTVDPLRAELASSDPSPPSPKADPGRFEPHRAAWGQSATFKPEYRQLETNIVTRHHLPQRPSTTGESAGESRQRQIR